MVKPPRKPVTVRGRTGIGGSQPQRDQFGQHADGQRAGNIDEQGSPGKSGAEQPEAGHVDEVPADRAGRSAQCHEE